MFQKKELVLIIPVPRDKIKDVEELAASLGGSKSEQFDISQRNLGIEKESWFLSSSSLRGDCVIVYVEGKDVAKSMGALIAS